MAKTFMVRPDGVVVKVDQEFEQEAINNRGYKFANQAQVDEFKKQRSDYEATAGKPVSPEQVTRQIGGEPKEEEYDTTIYDNALAAGTPEPEAKRRAINVKKLLSERDVGTIREDTSGEGVLATPVAALEAATNIVPFGIIEFIEGGFGNFLEEQGFIDNPITAANIRRRKEANPTLTTAVGIGAAIAPAIGTLGATLAPQALGKVPRALEIAQALSKLDIGSKAVRSVVATGLPMARGLGVLREGAEESLEALARGNIEEEVAAAAAIAENAPNLAARTIAKVTGREAGEVAAQRVTEKMLAAETERLLQKQLQTRLQQLGAKPGVIRSVMEASKEGTPLFAAAKEGAKASIGKAKPFVVGGLTTTAIGAGISALTRGMAEKINIQQTDPDLSAEEASVRFWDEAWKGAVSGGQIAAAFGFGAPVATKALSIGVDVVNESIQKVARLGIPRLGSIFTDTNPQQIATAMDAQRELVRDRLPKAVNEVSEAFQTELDSGEKAIRAIQKEIRKQAGSRAGLEEFIGDSDNIVAAKKDALQKQWMKQDAKGNFTFDRAKLKKYFETTAPNPTTNELELPKEFIEYHTEVSKLNDSLKTLEQVNAFLSADADEMARVIRDPISRKIIEDLNLQFPASTALQQGRRFVELQETLAPVAAGGKPFGKKATELAGLAGLGGFLKADDFVSGLLPAAGGFGVAKTGIEVLFDPAAAISNLSELDALALRSSEVADAFSRSLIGSRVGIAAGQIIPKLSEKLEGEDVKKKGLTVIAADEAYKRDKELIEKLSNIDSLDALYGKTISNIEDIAPVISNGMVATTSRQVQFLAKKMADMRPKTNVQLDWEPKSRQLYSYGLYSNYVRNPDLILLDIEKKGFVSKEGLEVLTEVYPSKLQNLRVSLTSQLAETLGNGEKIDAKRQYLVDKILGINTSGLSPSEIKKNQESMRPTGGNTSGGSGKLPKLEGEGLPR